MKIQVLIYIYIAIALIVSRIPILKIYTALCNTLIHEVFHVICAALLSGKIFHKIILNNDASGLAATTVNSKFARIVIAYAGYTGSSFTAVALFYLINKGYFHMIISFFIVLSIISILLWVRNLYGFVWGISLILLLSFLIYKNYEVLIIHTSIFLSAVILLQSIFSAFAVCKLSFIRRKDAGDATSLAKATFIPAAVWGIVFFAQSLYAGYFVMKHFLI
ncbi:M50 family metallopeptidase [Metabacillus fastidiosus]|uniref:M50 family metallopeptidase n=1 Tax=Metabacillus fastidiosus TaxID=1458 RepID=UPI002E23369A|nr:M50 family metallopeptidase [Metabacillus fastidiosus]